jgi:hypothetical protein
MLKYNNELFAERRCKMRIIAWLILIVPGILAGIGIKWMRDSFFDQLAYYFPYLWMQLIAGVLAFGLGIYFIGGFIFFREKKKRRQRH